MQGLRRRPVEDRLAWIFGSPRSGSTWLLNLLAAGGDVVKIDEPGIGLHLGVLLTALSGLDADDPELYRVNDIRAGAPDYFFSDRYEDAWRPALRRLLLERLGAQLGRAALAVLKEPHGSQGADMIMSALPRSRLIFLLRDGRDVIDSELDAAQPGSWAMSIASGFELGDRMAYVRDRAQAWLWRVETVQRAFEAHAGDRRWLIRYEDLRADPQAVLRPLAEGLGLDPDAVGEAAERSTFERLPEDERGPGRFVRAAQPGLWRDQLSDEEQAEMMRVIGPKLAELGYE